MRTSSLHTYTSAVNCKPTGARTLAYFKNRKRDANRFGNWHRDPASDSLIFNGGWYVDLGDLKNGADAFNAMADFAKFSTTAEDIADLGRALRKAIPGVLS
ncbi:MAG TPA: hypothetical protein VOA64_16160 [Candidatus Dormibacteraeota bacterium]|nr:hypothetical protein [Candidatus Dormibacteraeota bacterium]